MYSQLSHLIEGLKTMEFKSMIEFKLWKEREEECTYTTYVQQTGANRPVLSESK